MSRSLALYAQMPEDKGCNTRYLNIDNEKDDETKQGKNRTLSVKDVAKEVQAGR